MEPIRRTWAEINLDHALYNWNTLKTHIGDVGFAAVVKADAYGHGVAMLAPLYEELGAAFMAVSNLNEAVELFALGTRVPRLVLGYTPPHAAPVLLQHNIHQAIFDADYAKALSANIYGSDSLPVHIKLDTGMGRLGFDCRSMEAAKASIPEILEVCALPTLSVQGIFTHFATADGDNDPDDSFVQAQYQRFAYVVDAVKKVYPHITVHCSNSAAALRLPQMHADAVRMGIALYGLTPSLDMKLPVNLKPVMCLKTVVAMVKTVSAGDFISYGRTYAAPGERTIATLPVGYADGYSRSLSNTGYVLIGGQKAPVVGRVCMDQTMVDVTGLAVQPGDEVILFGDAQGLLSADILARQCGTIGYEIVCGISKRVPRIYIQTGEIL